jgi:hypothetical protein
VDVHIVHSMNPNIEHQPGGNKRKGCGNNHKGGKNNKNNKDKDNSNNDKSNNNVGEERKIRAR